MEILFVLVVAYLIVYRTGVGTWCAITGKQTPWEKAREARQARNGNRSTDPNRTARGFFGRLYGDLWEDLNAWRDRQRARRDSSEPFTRPARLRNRIGNWLADLMDLARGTFTRHGDEKKDEPKADQGPDYVGMTVRPPESAPTMTTVLLPAAADTELSEPNPAGPEPTRTPVDAPAVTPAAVPASTDAVNSTGDEDTVSGRLRQWENQPERKPLRQQLNSGAEQADRQRRGLEDREPPPSSMAWLDPRLDRPAPVVPDGAPDERWSDQVGKPAEPAPADADLVVEPVAPLFPGVPDSVARSLPVVPPDSVNVFGGTADDYRSHGPDPLADPGTADAARIEARRDAINTANDEAAARREARDAGRPGTSDGGQAAPHLSLVPSTIPSPDLASTGSAHQNSTTNGGTMTNPASIEIATVGTLEGFGQDVQSAASGDWKQKVEAARNAASTAEFTNDPEISAALSQMDEHLEGLAAGGANLEAAMGKHKASEEALSGLGSNAAGNTASYKRN